MTAPIIALEAERAARAKRCVCGCGVFRRRGEGAFTCFECGAPKGALPLGAMPKLQFRCSCGSCFFLVSVRGLQCALCNTTSAFAALFREAFH